MQCGSQGLTLTAARPLCLPLSRFYLSALCSTLATKPYPMIPGLLAPRNWKAFLRRCVCLLALGKRRFLGDMRPFPARPTPPSKPHERRTFPGYDADRQAACIADVAACHPNAAPDKRRKGLLRAAVVPDALSSIRFFPRPLLWGRPKAQTFSLVGMQRRSVFRKKQLEPHGLACRADIDLETSLGGRGLFKHNACVPRVRAVALLVRVLGK